MGCHGFLKGLAAQDQESRLCVGFELQQVSLPVQKEAQAVASLLERHLPGAESSWREPMT